MALVKDTSYNNIFYDNVLSKLRSIITTDRPCTVYVAPSYQDYGTFSIRLWGSSFETDELFPDTHRKLYNTEIAIYSIGDTSESFYNQLYSDAERLYQLLFNNSNLSSVDYPCKDGQLSEVTFDEFTDVEEGIDNLHVARFLFSCRITR